MAECFTRFSCLLDVGTVENAARALDIYNDLMAQNAAEDPPAEPFLLSIEPEHGPTRLWMRDPGTADPQLLITFVTRCAEAFGLAGRWGFQWAGIASEPRIDGFSVDHHRHFDPPAGGRSPASLFLDQRMAGAYRPQRQTGRYRADRSRLVLSRRSR